MKTVPVLLANCFLVAVLHGVAFAQATPEATSNATVPTLNTAPVAGVLSYSLGASESLLIGYNGESGVSSTSNVSGTASFVSLSQKHPTSFLYSAGYLFGDGTGQPSSTYQNFGISQVLNTKNMTFLAGDQVSYLPNAPIFALSGVPGLGDIGTEPIGEGSIPVASILTDFGRRVTNTANGSVTDRITGETSLSGFGDYTLLRFPDGNGIEDNEVDAGASLDHRLSGTNTFGVGYVYSNFSYLSGYNLTMTTQEVNVQYQHVFSPKLLLAASAGPERITSSDPTLIPDSTTVAADFSLFYKAEFTKYLLSFSRGTSSGSGVQLGTIANNVNFTATRAFGPNWQGSFSANYGYASGLETIAGLSTTAASIYAGVQATRKLGRYFSAYGSYNLEEQSINQPVLEFNAFSGTSNVIGLGITYSPRPIHLGHP